ncbi:Ig-like domain-containing protein [Konateibacter massiliensis]|uniref:Ig-like domain-containing protein n=1 Tax=Konateibacter massiliensis TaxID=2002841 RepID=UPI000C15A3E8|nr:Ig-like domain-containing protein [Konateibacter massiliensis]
MKNIIIKKLSLLAVLVLIISLIVPSFTTTSLAVKLPKKRTVIYYNTIVIAKGENINQYFYKSGKDYTNKAKWSTSNKKIATIDKNGKIKAKKKGKVTITAKYGGKKYKCIVYVVSRKTLYEDKYIKIQTKYMTQSNNGALPEQIDEKELKEIKLKVTNKTEKEYLFGATKLKLNSRNLKLGSRGYGNTYLEPKSAKDWSIITTWSFGDAKFPENISKLKTVTATFKLSDKDSNKKIKTINIKNKKVK